MFEAVSIGILAALVVASVLLTMQRRKQARVARERAEEARRLALASSQRLSAPAIRRYAERRVEKERNKAYAGHYSSSRRKSDDGYTDNSMDATNAAMTAAVLASTYDHDSGRSSSYDSGSSSSSSSSYDSGSSSSYDSGSSSSSSSFD